MKSSKLIIFGAILLAITFFMFWSGEFDTGGHKDISNKSSHRKTAGVTGKKSRTNPKRSKIPSNRNRGTAKNHPVNNSNQTADSGSDNLEDLDRWLNEGSDNNSEDTSHTGDWQNNPEPQQYDHDRMQMTQEDMQNELDFVLQIDDPAERRQALVELGKAMGYRADPDMVADFLRSLPAGSDKDAYMAGYIKTMVNAQNPEAVTQVLAALGDKNLSASMIPLLAARWAAKDLQGAYKWAVQIIDPRNQNIAMVKIGRVMAISDPEGAAQWATNFTDKAVSSNIMDYAIKIWARKDLNAAADWVTQLNEGNAKERMVNSVVIAWARRDPVAAADWVIKNDVSQNRDNILASVASAWSLKDPEQASKWAAQFPNAKSRNIALAQTTYQWAKRDAVSAAQWADSLPIEQGQLRALAGVASGWAVKDPASAANWVDGIQDNALRNQLQESVARQWLNRDREQATAWIMASDLSEAAQKRLLPHIAPDTTIVNAE